MADITENISGAGQSNSSSQANAEMQVTGCGKPIRREPPTVEEALSSELSAAAALLRLAVEWRAACQSRVARAELPKSKTNDSNFGGEDSELLAAIELSALSEMPEFRRYRKAIAEFIATVRRTDLGRGAVQPKS